MQELMGFIRRAITEYDMIRDGDHIAVGVSGGKDSVALLAGLTGVRRFIGIDFKLTAITVDNQFDGMQTDYNAITDLCDQLGVAHIIRRSEIGQIVFDMRKETNPCSLCARMRRGILHDLCNEHGCQKIALGHHYNDAVETFMMNLLHEGRIGCFSPVTYLSRKDITMIRPLIFATEKDVIRAVRRGNLPVVKSTCPIDGCTAREDMKTFLQNLEKTDSGVTKRIFGAMKRAHISGW